VKRDGNYMSEKSPMVRSGFRSALSALGGSRAIRRLIAILQIAGHLEPAAYSAAPSHDIREMQPFAQVANEAPARWEIMLSMRFSLTCVFASVVAVMAAGPPVAEISNGKIRSTVYLPDPVNGFYQGTRFDWSGVIRSLEANGHSYYGPWFTRRSETVRDFIYDGEDIVAGPCSSTMGPADEFGPLGYDAAKPGGTFVKIGVGVLKRIDDKAYDAFKLYPIADHGKWSVKRKDDLIEILQILSDGASGYAYEYRKTLRLVKGKSEMKLEHSLKNIGKNAIETQVYNHNFLVIDGKGPQAGTTVMLPFAVTAGRKPNPELAEIQGNKIVYKKTLAGEDVVFFPITGFGDTASDHEIRVENTALKAGMSMRGDKPLEKVSLWSIRSNVSVEPFIAVSVAPRNEFRWTSSYRYYSIP
jgi:hypothetical protein